MQGSIAGATVTERGVSAHTVSWSMLADRCESARERCKRPGEDARWLRVEWRMREDD